MIFNTGYYKVNNQIILEKVAAVYEANKTKADIDWYFHDDVYNATDWTTEPVESLDELYRQRAQQLRDKYDYIVAFFSGGADSTNMVYSFLKNGIHLDEIVAGAPVSGLSNWQDSTDASAENTISETRLSQLPELKEIAEKYPTTKITIHDYFVDMLEYKTDEWLWKSGNYIHPTFAARYRLERDEYNYLKKIADSGKRICFLYGLDKPCIVEHKNFYYVLFRDILVNNGFPALDHPMASVELFYYNGDLPRLMVKQAHVTARYISRAENLHLYNNMIYNSKNIIPKISKGWRWETDPNWEGGFFERGIVPAIYPMLDKKVFQAKKPTTAFFAQHDAWFEKLHKDTTTWQMMKSDFKLFINGIDQKYYTIDRKTNLPVKFNTSMKYYKIGETHKFGLLVAIT
jgi:hypothetical protein